MFIKPRRALNAYAGTALVAAQTFPIRSEKTILALDAQRQYTYSFWLSQATPSADIIFHHECYANPKQDFSWADAGHHKLVQCEVYWNTSEQNQRPDQDGVEATLHSTIYDCEDYYYEYYYGHEEEEEESYEQEESPEEVCVDLVGWEDDSDNDCDYYNQFPGYCGEYYTGSGDLTPASGITATEACCICQEWEECSDDDDWVGTNGEGCYYYEEYPYDCGDYDADYEISAFEACCSCSLVAEQYYNLASTYPFDPATLQAEAEVEEEEEEEDQHHHHDPTQEQDSYCYAMTYENWFLRDGEWQLQEADSNDIVVATSKEVHGDSKSKEFLFAWTTNLCTGYTDDFCVAPGAPDYIGSALNMIASFGVTTYGDTDETVVFSEELQNINIMLPLNKMYDDAYWQENSADVLAEQAILRDVLLYTVGVTLLASILIVVFYVNSSRPEALDMFIP